MQSSHLPSPTAEAAPRQIFAEQPHAMADRRAIKKKSRNNPMQSGHNRYFPPIPTHPREDPRAADRCHHDPALRAEPGFPTPGLLGRPVKPGERQQIGGASRPRRPYPRPPATDAQFTLSPADHGPPGRAHVYKVSAGPGGARGAGSGPGGSAGTAPVPPRLRLK